MPEEKVNIIEIKNTIKEALAAKLEEDMRQGAAIAAKTAVAFVGASLGIFLRDLLKNDTILQELAKTKKEELRAILRTALSEIWEKAHRIFFETLKEGIRGGNLEANIFAEKVMRHIEEE